MARKNAVTNSQRKMVLAARSSLIASSLCRYVVLDDGGDDRHHRQRQRQENLPTQPHQLIVAITWNNGLDHGEHEKQEQRLEREPDHARHPGERWEWNRRQPAAQE